MAAFAPVGSGPVGVGFVGVGNISDTYIENLKSFPDLEVLILGDLLTDRAASQAQKHGIPASGSTADVLAHRLPGRRRRGGGGRVHGPLVGIAPRLGGHPGRGGRGGR